MADSSLSPIHMEFSFPVPETDALDQPHINRTLSQYSSATLEKDQEQLWANLRQFYLKNEETIERSRKLDFNATADEKFKQVNDAVDTFVDTANVVLDGLVALGNVHPILGVAIFAFHGVIRLDLARRSNNRKVLAVKLQMQTMMCTMFQLCRLKHIHVHDAQKEFERNSLQRLVKTIADEITQCGSDLNYYSTRKLVSKLIKAKLYERRFAEHVETFTQRRSELQTTIAAYIAAGMDAANIAISEVGSKVNLMDNKLDSLLTFFQRLDTPQEREALKFIDDNGGADNCVNKDDLLQTLLSKSEDVSEESLNGMVMRTNLQVELMEDLDAVLSQNLKRFEKLLNVQNNNLERILGQIEQQGLNMYDHNMKLDKLVSTSILILEEGKLIKKAVIPTTQVKLEDPELQQIWDRMGLRRSVKAKQFVLTFRDYLITTDRSAPGTPFLQGDSALHPEPSSVLFSTPLSGAPEKLPPQQLKPEGESDLWVLKHIDVAHIQPIIEAMDEDGSGFISVKEANKFALSRPKGLSLLHWIAYWAAGWHYTITDYRRKIYSIMLQMHNMASSVLQVNKKVVHVYLDNSNFFRLESILRSIRPLPEGSERDPKLVEISESVASAEEERLKVNLKEMTYLIQSPADVALIAGTGRLETWILPLVYLVLNRHLEIFKIARTRVLHMDELSTHSTSLWSIMSSYDERIGKLKDIFRQIYRDAEAQFGNFAYGMFVGSFKWTGIMKPVENTLLDFKDPMTSETPETTASSSGPPEALDLSILAKGLGPSLEMENPDLQVPSSPPDHLPHPIEGSWVASSWVGKFPETDHTNAIPPFQFVIGPVVDGKIAAVGRDYEESLEINGTLDADGEHVDFKLAYKESSTRRFRGKYDCEKDVIRGQWVIDSESGEFPPPDDTINDGEEFKLKNGHFHFTRNPVNAFRFRYLLDDPDAEQNPPLSLARKRWTFATEAVRFDVQERMKPWKFMRARIEERNAWIELSIRDLVPAFLTVTRGFSSPEETKRWRTLVQRLHPNVSALYETMAIYLYDRFWYSIGAISCDTCRQRIVFRRYFCITCIEEDQSNQLDFCVDGKCADSLTVFESRDFVHSFSHTLLRCTQRLIHYEVPTVISQAEIRSERIKRSFREKEAKENGGKDLGRKSAKILIHAENELQGKPSLVSLICACCSKVLSLPCWACATCIVDTLICFKCEELRKPIAKKTNITNTHTSDHHLLRISDSVEAKLVKLKSNSKQLEDMEARINMELGELQIKVDAQENKMSSQLTSLETKVETLLSLMQQVITANSGQSPNI